MEKEKKSQSASETDFLLQWGTKKRLRCVKAKKDQNFASQSKPSDHSLPKKKLPSRFVNAEKESSSHATKNSELSMNNRKAFALSPEKEEKRVVWPRLYIALSSKEKEEDFMAMKGCKPPQRPKKRAKLIQRTLLLVSPGAWLTDLCQERYEVREKKSKKRPTGLKAMGSMESDSE